MQKNFNIPDELKDVAPCLASLDKQNIYSTPAGYFESLSDEVMASIRLSMIETGDSVYSVPLGYFDRLPEQILTAIKGLQESKPPFTADPELAEIAPLLNTINRRNLFTVPEDYFDNYQLQIPELKPEAKVLQLKDRFRTYLHYAVAASVIFVIASGSFIYVNQHTKNSAKSVSIEQRIASLSEDDIVNYLKYGHPDDEIIPASKIQDNKIENMLNGASDEEILRYLDEENDSNEKPVNGI